MSMEIMQPVIKGRIDMLEDIMGWNWTNIFLGIIAFTIVRIYFDFLDKNEDMKYQIIQIRETIFEIYKNTRK